MEPDEVVLSDIHIDTTDIERTKGTYELIGKYPVFLSRFVFRRILEKESEEKDKGVLIKDGMMFDKDGDLILSRQQERIYQDVIIIEHTLSTHLPDVGLQVWPGCMLLCDFILDNYTSFENQLIVELGAGVGLASITAALFAKKVTATDSNLLALELCRRNASNNQHIHRNYENEPPTIDVHKLNWQQLQCHEGAFVEDLATCFDVLHSANVIMAADVIYSDDKTDSLFQTISEIMRNAADSQIFYLSVEKRLNFTLDCLDVACPAYEYFCACIKQFHAKVIPEIPQYFKYKRSKYLELWQITSQKSSEEEKRNKSEKAVHKMSKNTNNRL